MVDEKKAKQIQKQQRKEARQQPKGQAAQETEAQLRAREARAERIARDKEANRQRQQAANEKAIAAQIKQLIDTNRIDRKNGDIAYQFTHGKKIKKLYVTPLLQNQLSHGQIAIVVNGGNYELVPTQVADKIKQRDDSVVLLQNVAGTQEVDEDDPYADYQIPDDLMW